MFSIIQVSFVLLFDHLLSDCNTYQMNVSFVFIEDLPSLLLHVFCFARYTWRFIFLDRQRSPFCKDKCHSQIQRSSSYPLHNTRRSPLSDMASILWIILFPHEAGSIPVDFQKLPNFFPFFFPFPFYTYLLCLVFTLFHYYNPNSEFKNTWF